MSQVSPVPDTGKPLPFSAISAQLSFLKGEILTIADAAFSDKEQRKAFKDLVRNAFTQRLNYLAVLCEDGSVPCSAGSVPRTTATEDLERAGFDYQYKIIPVHRKTLKPLFEPIEIGPQFEVNIPLMSQCATLARTDGRSETPLMVPVHDLEIQTYARSVARMLAEMFAADVWYRPKASDSWELQPNTWAPKQKSK